MKQIKEILPLFGMDEIDKRTTLPPFEIDSDDIYSKRAQDTTNKYFDWMIG